MTKERLGLKLHLEIPSPGLLVTKQTDPWATNDAGVYVCVCVCVCVRVLVWVTSSVKVLLGRTAECQMPTSLYAEVSGTQICACESLHISVQNLCSQATYKIKGNVFLVHAMKAYRVIGGIAPLILIIGVIWR